jgi:hypothetical protein
MVLDLAIEVGPMAPSHQGTRHHSHGFQKPIELKWLEETLQMRFAYRFIASVQAFYKVATLPTFKKLDYCSSMNPQKAQPF